MNSDSLDAQPIPLFLHIPKTGGTTLNNCIYNQYRTDQNKNRAEGGKLVSGVYYYPAGLHKDPTLTVPAHVKGALARQDVRAVTGHFSFGIHRYVTRPFTYITLLRHPVDRVLSLYYHIRKYKDTELHHEVTSRNLSVEDFVLNLSCREVDNDQTRRIAGLEPDFGRCSTSTLSTARENLRRLFSIVGVTERFDETLILMKRTLGWAKEPFYFSDLVNKDKPGRGAVPQRTIDVIAERHLFDLELYQFANELLQDRIGSQDSSFETELNRFRLMNGDYQTRVGEETKSSRTLDRTV